MILKVFSQKSDVETLKDGWRDLFSRCDDLSVFQSYEWNNTWLQHTDNLKPFIVADMRNDGELRALFPFSIDERGIVQFIADIHSDYSAFIIEPMSNTQRYALFKNLKTVLLENGCKGLKLTNVRNDDENIALFATLFDERQWLTRTNGYSDLNVAYADKEWQAFSYLPSKKRSELKRISKNWLDYESVFLEKKNSNFPLQEIQRLAERMRQEKVRDPAFFDSTLFEVSKTLYEAELLQIHAVRDKTGMIHVMNLMMKNREGYILWIDLFENKKYANIAGYVKLIEKLSRQKNEGSFKIDFGRGLYRYKLENFMPEVHNQFTFYWASTQSLFFWQKSLEYAKSIVKPFYKKNKHWINRILGR